MKIIGCALRIGPPIALFDYVKMLAQFEHEDHKFHEI